MGVIDDLERATHLVAVGLGPVWTELGLGQAEAHVLAQLAGRDSVTANELHRDFGHKRSTLTNVLDRLEQRGLIERAPNPADRRSIAVKLTPPGHAPAQRVLAARQQLDRELTARLAPEQLGATTAIVGALREITDNPTHAR
jgi:DNA-binding MarR family transcriptional regulator